MVTVACTLNGTPRAIEVEPRERLLDVVRRIGLTGTKEGCGEGECGSCTVLMNGLPVNSCLVIASQMEGAAIVTVEGLAGNERLTPLQEHFIREGGAQCGICTPGFLISARYLQAELDGPASSGESLFDVDLLRRWRQTKDADPGAEGLDRAADAQIRLALCGNICRCTGYDAIIRAVKQALRSGELG